MKHIIYFAVFIFIIGCNNNSNDNIIVNREAEKTIIIEDISDKPFDNVNELLKMDSYAVLSPNVLLAEIKRVLYYKKNIYVFDSKDRIICYNKDGSIKYKIDAKGKGPGEYSKIMDFTIDKVSNKINIFTRTLLIMSYSATDGSYMSTKKLDFVSEYIACSNEGNYFYQSSNPYRVSKSTDYLYNLMWSEELGDIDKKYFAQDPEVANFNFGFGNPFFDNNSQLFFINQFDDIVYSLKENGIISPKFEIKLPNAATVEDAKKKPDLRYLLKSDYSIGITNIFQCKDILYFTFSKNGSYNHTYYNLKTNTLLYCGQRIWPFPSKELPIYYPIAGVAENQFFNIIRPRVLIDARKQNPDVFPPDLLNLKETDNPVLMFYGIKD